MIQAVASGAATPDDWILLHVTGGGRVLQYTGSQIFNIAPNIEVEQDDLEGAVEAIGRPFTIEQPRRYIKSYLPSEATHNYDQRPKFGTL